MQRRFIHALGTAVLIASLFSLMFVSGFFAVWQDRATDTLFLPRQPHPDIVIVSIDNPSLQELGRWPWDRSIHAELLRKLGKNPAAVGYDIAFPEPSTASHDAALADAMKQTRGTVLPVEAGIITVRKDDILITRLLNPIPQLAEAGETGLVNTIAGQDSVTRHVPIRMIRQNGNKELHFSERLAKIYAYNTNRPDPTSAIVTSRGLMKINFTGHPGTIPMYSFIDVLEGRVPAERFKDKIVLVGVTAVDLRDNQITAVSAGQPMSGVEIHANALQTILEGKYLKTEPKWQTVVTMFALSLLVAVIMTYIGLIVATVLVVVLMIVYVIYAFLAFDFGNIHNLIYPLLVILLSYITLALYRYFLEYNQRRFLRKAFSFYVSPSVLDEIIKDPGKLTLGGMRREMTVFFADIAGFTTISETLPPDELSLMLNDYLTRASRIIFHHTGVIDKFIGDAIMAFWNAPLDDKEHALNACRAAIEMEEEVRKIKEEWEHANVKGFSVRIGINTGEMVVGNMGSDMRFDYTVLGDNVNLASRMEGINKVYGTKILISQATYNLVKEEVVARLVDDVVVKGKKKGVKLYELMRLGNADAAEQHFLEQFDRARNLYLDGSFKEALKEFEAFVKDYPDDPVATLYVKRCQEYIDEPPEDWDGLYRPDTK